MYRIILDYLRKLKIIGLISVIYNFQIMKIETLKESYITTLLDFDVILTEPYLLILKTVFVLFEHLGLYKVDPTT